MTGVSILFGFGTTLAAAKKKDPHFFDQGLSGRFEGQAAAEPLSSEAVAAMRRRAPGSISSAEPGASLALRALGWGSLYAVTGCSLLFYGIWKLMAVNDVSINPLSFYKRDKRGRFSLVCSSQSFNDRFSRLRCAITYLPISFYVDRAVLSIEKPHLSARSRIPL